MHFTCEQCKNNILDMKTKQQYRELEFYRLKCIHVFGNHETIVIGCQSRYRWSESYPWQPTLSAGSAQWAAQKPWMLIDTYTYVQCVGIMSPSFFCCTYSICYMGSKRRQHFLWPWARTLKSTCHTENSLLKVDLNITFPWYPKTIISRKKKWNTHLTCLFCNKE